MRPSLILIGGGGHCASCIDVIEQEDLFEIAGIVDGALTGKQLICYPVLGGDEMLGQLRSCFDYAFITVGQITSSSVRIHLFKYLKSLGFKLPTIVSPRAYVSEYATIGEGTIVMHDALVNARAVIGNNCIINTKALIEHDAVIEDNCHISTAATVNGGSLIRQGSFIGSNSVIRESVQTTENAFIKAGSFFKGCSHG